MKFLICSFLLSLALAAPAAEGDAKKTPPAKNPEAKAAAAKPAAKKGAPKGAPKTAAKSQAKAPAAKPAAGKPAPPKVYAIGYDDTPLITGSKWKVHDIDRPRPKHVMPGENLGDAPEDAIILFDGTSTDAFYSKNKETGEILPCPWEIVDGTMLVSGGDSWTKQEFGSCQFHIEWRSHPETEGNSQKKGNGGVFFMDLYECQILDTWKNPTYADGMTGCIYGQTPPLVNAIKPAGRWQTYDIIFTAPELDKDGKVIKPAYVTTFVNGVCVQVHTEIQGPTTHKKPTSYEGRTFPTQAPIRLQDHKNDPPIQLRNIWIRPLD